MIKRVKKKKKKQVNTDFLINKLYLIAGNIKNVILLLQIFFYFIFYGSLWGPTHH